MIGLEKRARRSTPSERAKMRAYYRKNKGRLRRQRRRRERKPRIKKERHGTPEGGGYTQTREISLPSRGGSGGSAPVSAGGGAETPDFDPEKNTRSLERLIEMRSEI